MMFYLTSCYLLLDLLLVRVCASEQPVSGPYHRSYPQHAADDDLDDSDLDLSVDDDDDPQLGLMLFQSNVASAVDLDYWDEGLKSTAASDWASNDDEEDDLDATVLDYASVLLEKKSSSEKRAPARRHDSGALIAESSGAELSNDPVVNLYEDTAGEGDGGSPCAGHFTPYSECQESCFHWRQYVVDSHPKDGGEPCLHPHHFVEQKPCTGNKCLVEELPPTGDLPAEEKPATHIHHLATEVALPFALAIILSMCIGEVVHHVPWLSAIPHSLVTILVAGCMGFMLRSHEDRFGADAFSPVCTVVMNLVLLPIIIFQAGWGMRHKDFYDNFLYICIFAVIGTAISTLLIGMIVWTTGNWGWHVITGAREAFAIASLISATDPVATLAAFTLKKVEPRLNILVLGESTINDAVAIAIFNMLNIDEPTAYFFLPSAAMKTSKLLFCSIAIGMLMAFILVMLFRAVRAVTNREDSQNTGHEASQDHGTSFEVVYVLGSAYLINAVAECCHMSGIIACLFGGVFMGIYLKAHLSSLADQNTSYYITTAAETADLTVFIMVGVTTALIKSSKGFRFGAFLILFCIVGRAVTVLICGGLCNSLHKARFGGEFMEFMSKEKFVMMWHAGLRGGIALTLALQLNDWCEHKAVLVTGTFIVIFALMVLCGSTIDFMLNLCKIETGCIIEKDQYKDLHLSTKETRGVCSWIHNSVLHPLLVGDATLQTKQAGV